MGFERQSVAESSSVSRLYLKGFLRTFGAGLTSLLGSNQTTGVKKLAPESTDNYADDGSANGSHADDWCVSFCDDGIGDAQQQSEE
jgi:hypothetical protein